MPHTRTTRRRTVLSVLVAGLVLTGTGPALAVIPNEPTLTTIQDACSVPGDPARALPTPAPPASAPPASDPPTPAPAPSQADALTQAAARVAADRAALEAANDRATAAMACFAQSQLAADLATREAADQEERLSAAQTELELRRDQLGAYAAGMYRSSGANSSSVLAARALLLARDVDSALSTAALVQKTASRRGQVVSSLTVAETAQRVATEAATDAARRAAEAREAAARARADADAEVARFTSAVTASTAQLTSTLRALPPGTCPGGDLAGFPNGQLPIEALCPLWAAPGQALRADAANAFAAMSAAYAAVFGTPICVTDSYRSLPDQVDLRIRKPTLAAVPGTSRHGWGLAVDLCGGVEDATSLQHQWLRQSSLAYGFFHPPWAETTGSKPEAWHWEYAGAQPSAIS